MSNMQTKSFTKIIITGLLLLVSHAYCHAQIFPFKKGESKKELKAQRDSLLTIVSNLQQELEIIKNEHAVCDTIIIDDADMINPGVFDLYDSEELIIDRITDTDSLLSIWYNHRNIAANYDKEIYEIDSMIFESNIPDSIYISRLEKMNSFIQLPYNPIVRNHIIYYTQKIPNKIEVILGLSRYYMPLFEEIFDEYDLPKELKVMAIIESALNPKAVSRAKARGMWQFMYRTALQYDLTINSYVDERYDPIKSGHAAAKYLLDSYNIFGDWNLAIASYNCGAGNVNKAIRRAGSREFWDIYPFLPRETRSYVPSFVAALYTLNYYKEHRILPQEIVMPAHVDTINVNKMLHFDQICETIGINKEELRNLNPQYLHDIIPGGEKEYILRLPYNYTMAFVEKESEIYKYKDSVFFNPNILRNIRETGSSSATQITHIVKKGETPGGIARRYGVKLADLQRWNGIKNTIRIGQRLTVYTSGRGPIASASSSTVASSRANISESGDYITYTVKKGDTLWDIAKLFPGISANNILDLNGMAGNARIYPGMTLKIKKK